MIKIYSMQSCPDCESVKQQASGNGNYQIIDIGAHAKNLKEFLNLRDTNPAFDRVKQKGTIGIPCFILEDGSVTFKPELAGLEPRQKNAAQACNLDGSGC